MADLFSAAAGDERRIYDVGELNEAIEAALQAAFPAAVWVRGEVQGLHRNRNGHIYFELHGTSRGSVDEIRVSALKWDRERFGLDRWFDGSSTELTIRDSLEICLQGVVTYHPKWGLSLKLVAVDSTFTLGRLEALRRETLAWLQAEGLLERNRRLAMPELPLRVGLITSAGSAAEKDLLAGLAASGYGFRVLRADSRMMGERMVEQVTGALGALAAAGPDVIVISRGGGSRADLSWFDRREIAAAIATCPVPVITAIGHEIDTSIADLVAHHHCKTPTAAAQDLIDRVAESERRLETAAHAVADGAAAVLDGGRRVLDRAAAALQTTAALRLRRRYETLARRREAVLGAARHRLARARARTDEAARRLREAAPRPLAARRERLDRLADKAALLDPVRLLARGWSVTTGPDGRPLRDPRGLTAGDRIATRLHAGRIVSIVDGIETTDEA